MELAADLVVPGGGGRCWKVIQPLGKGTCCVVYQVVLVGEQQQGALKVYKDGSEYEGAHYRELMILDLLKQGSQPDLVVEVLDEFRYHGHSCCVQELLVVNPRQMMLRCGGEPLSLWLIQRLTRDILSGMKLVHEEGYVHGDIKPTNLMWSPLEGRLKIIDFGLSFHVDDENIGEIQSPSYRAPEAECWIKNNQNQLDPLYSHHGNTNAYQAPRPNLPSDMWSIGCCLVEFFTSEKLFSMENKKHRLLIAEGKSDAEVLVEKLLKPRESDASDGLQVAQVVVSHLSDLILKMLQTSPRDRISAASALSHPFLQCELEPGYVDLLLIPCNVLRMLNMVTSEDLENDQELQEIREDIESECAKFGMIKSTLIPKDGNGKEKVYVEYFNWEDAQQAFMKLNGRSFAGRTVITTYFPLVDYLQGDCY